MGVRGALTCPCSRPSVRTKRLCPDMVRLLPQHGGHRAGACFESSDWFSDKVAFIWSVADLLRGDYKAHEYGQVILPLTVLRRLDCVLEPTRGTVVARARDLAGKIDNIDPILLRTAGQPFYNVSPLDFTRLLDDPSNVAGNPRSYIAGYSTGAVEVLEKYGFDNQITRLDDAGLLYQVISRFADVDLHPDAVPNEAMGYVFEELLRKFSEMSNETAGEHFTPREVIRVMVNILFSEDDDALSGTAPVRTMFDPACGTGGMLTAGQEHLASLNPRARLEVFGQELNSETWAIARSDLMIKGQNPERIVLGNSFTADGFTGQHFDYMLANPPFGVDWKRIQRQITDEADQLGDRGRFGAGLPRVSDGALLFLQHMLSKMKPVSQGGGRGAQAHPGQVHLSEIIDLLNEKFGTELTEVDQVWFDQQVEAAAQDPDLREVAGANTEENFGYVFDQRFANVLIDRQAANDDLFRAFFDKPEFKDALTVWARREVYKKITEDLGGAA